MYYNPEVLCARVNFVWTLVAAVLVVAIHQLTISHHVHSLQESEKIHHRLQKIGEIFSNILRKENLNLKIETRANPLNKTLSTK